MTNSVVEVPWQSVPLFLMMFWYVASLGFEEFKWKAIAPYLPLIDNIVFRSTAVFYALLFLYHAVITIKIV